VTQDFYTGRATYTHLFMEKVRNKLNTKFFYSPTHAQVIVLKATLKFTLN